jgi:hypothetical protein
MEMKKWIAERLILLAVWLDVETVVYASLDIVRSLNDVIKQGESDD